MIDNNINFYNKLILFWSKVKKQGFTLAEALIVTVMTGYCLLPILGTMQNAQNRTQEYDHQSKMQLYTRSRLNEEIANAAFDHTSVNTDTEYHYIVYLDKGESGRNGDEEHAQLVELPKTSITPEQLKTLEKTSVDNWNTEAMNFVGIKKIGPKGYLNIVYIYQTSVETRNTPPLEYNGSTSTDNETSKALLGIFVKTCLLQSPDGKYDETTGMLADSDESIQVAPFSLFSFVNLPVVTDETIWLADALYCKIYGVDPISRGVNTIELPTKNSGNPANGGNDEYRPLSIAVHPNLKILACLTKKCLYLINIDRKGNNYGEYYEYYKFSADGLHYHDQQAYKFVCFRPDGKYLFVSPVHHKDFTKHAVVAFEITCYFESSPDKIDWDPENSKPAMSLSNFKGSLTNEKTIVSALPANDGYLYVAYEDKNLGVIRFPMYSPVIENNDSEWVSETVVSYRARAEGESEEDYANNKNNLTSNITSIDVSPDGSRLAIIAGTDLYIFDTRNKEKITSANIKKEDLDTGESVFEPNKVSFSALSNSTQDKIYDDKNLILTVTNKIPGQTNIAYVFYYNSSGKVITKLRGTSYYSDSKGGNLAINTPDNLSVVLSDQQKSQLYFGTVGKNNSNDVISEANNNFTLISNSSDNVKNVADITTNKRNSLAAATPDKKIKLYDINTLKQIEDVEFSADNTITSLAMNPQGNMLLTGFGSGIGEGDTGFIAYNLNDLLGSSKKGSAFGKKAVFDDRTPNMAFALEYPTGTGDEQNAFWNIDTPYSETPPPPDDPNWAGADSAYVRRDLDLHSDWKRLDLIGMPNGGAMALYGKDDGSSILEWIGRRNWDQDRDKIGKYKLFARWTNIYKAPVLTTQTYLPNYSTLPTTFARSDGEEGLVNIIDSPLEANSIVNTFDFKADNVFFDDPAPRFITPILLKKELSGNFKVVNYATNAISSTRGIENTDVSITWNAPFKIDKSNTYHLGWWNGRNTTKYKGMIAYDSDLNMSGKILAGSVAVDRLEQLTTTDFNPSSYSYKRNYSVRFKITSATPSESKDNFPPLGSKLLAISPDCGTLAIIATSTSDYPLIHLYDFNNQIYGQETQLEGMLVDYRIPCQTGVWGGSDYIEEKKNSCIWPAETESLFKEVIDKARFNKYVSDTEQNIPTFASATTKFDSWKSFNTHPSNYLTFSDISIPINQSKATANKRFFGYIRPEYNVDYLQVYGGDDIRFFYNNLILDGRYEQKEFVKWNSSIIFKHNAYHQDLFQIDSASNEGPMALSVFLGETEALETINEDFSPVWEYGDNSINNTISISKEKWKPLLSSETYILYNKPSFMSSFKAQTTTGSTVTLNTNYINMLFSRDKAKPVLYIAGNKYVWVLYKNSLIRTYKEDSDEGDNITSNIAISEDGQKLLYAKQIGGIASISVNNISNPDETQFDATITSDELTSKQINAKRLIVSDFANSYLKETSNITIKGNAPSLIATKPHLSYKSSNGGGEYLKLVDDYTFTISNNAAAVASGGIYIIGSDTKKIVVFNPTISRNNPTLLSNHLKKAANSAVITAYNDTLYTFGNAKVGNENLGGRVQRFDVNTGESITSNQRESDTYRASMYYNALDLTHYVKVEGNDNGFSPIENAFINNSSDWIDNGTTSNVTYYYSTNRPFVVNQIIINNDSKWNGSVKDGTREFKFVGINGSSETELASGTLGNPETKTIDFNNNVAYEKYRFYAQSTHAPTSGSGGNTVGLKELSFYRTGLVRLTPKKSSEIYSSDEANHWMKYKNNNIASATILWNTNDSSAYFYQIYQNFGSSDDDYNNYEGTFSLIGGQSWRVDSGYTPKLRISFSEPETLKFLRYSDNGNIASIQIYGSNNDEVPSDSPSDGWTEITTLGTLPNIEEYWIPNEIPNSTKYKHYLFVFGYTSSFRLYGFELYGTINNDDTMTHMEDDDLNEVKAKNGAACATPYGLVYTGGHNDSGDAINDSLLYWPHAVNKYDGDFYQYGIPRSLPNMKNARANHALVWHKGKIYAIGGRADSTKTKIYGNSTTYADFIEVLDYNQQMEWKTYPKPYKYVDGADVSHTKNRYNFGACSFGDEIFIFGGEDSSDTPRTSAIAFNPETGVVRKLTDMYEVLGDEKYITPCVAVPFGSKIYIIGNDSASPYPLKILEYTP